MLTHEKGANHHFVKRPRCIRGALHLLADFRAACESREASWTAVVLGRFSARQT